MDRISLRRLYAQVILLSAASPGATAQASNVEAYFPPALLNATISCGSFFRHQTVPVISALENRWYSEQLRAANEPVLSTRMRRPVQVSIRFTWLRSFHSPVVVRVEDVNGVQPRLIAKELSGKGGYTPGIVARLIDRSLGATEASRLRQLLARSNVLALPQRSCDFGLDGAQWLIEGVDAAGYHLVDRWSPDRGEVRTVGLSMLALTGWQFKDIY